VNKEVVATFLGDETETLVPIEPLNGAFCTISHCCFSFVLGFALTYYDTNQNRLNLMILGWYLKEYNSELLYLNHLERG
jgi:hypothetical protein